MKLSRNVFFFVLNTQSLICWKKKQKKQKKNNALQNIFVH